MRGENPSEQDWPLGGAEVLPRQSDGGRDGGNEVQPEEYGPDGQGNHAEIAEGQPGRHLASLQ